MDDSDSPLDQPDHPDQGNHGYQEIPKEKKNQSEVYTSAQWGAASHT